MPCGLNQVSFKKLLGDSSEEVGSVFAIEEVEAKPSRRRRRASRGPPEAEDTRTRPAKETVTMPVSSSSAVDELCCKSSDRLLNDDDQTRPTELVGAAEGRGRCIDEEDEFLKEFADDPRDVNTLADRSGLWARLNAEGGKEESVELPSRR